LAIGVRLETDWPWWTSVLLFALVMVTGLGKSETIRFVTDDSGITIPRGRERRVYSWEQIGSIRTVHDWRQREPRPFEREAPPERFLHVTWTVLGVDGKELFQFDPSVPGAEELANEIRSRVEPPNTETSPPDPRIRQRMQSIYTGSVAARSETLECRRCGKQVDRKELTRLGALRVDEHACVCPVCLRKGRTG
jgi:hypothetical protein